MNLQNKNVQMAIVGMTAALYVVLGYVFQPISFMQLQFRIAEIITGMCIIFPMAGLTGNVLGVFLLNLSSPLGLMDVLFMPLVNIPALACIIITRKMKWGKYVGGVMYAFIISAGVALELTLLLGLPFLLMLVQVFIPEIILATIGIMIFSRVNMYLFLDEESS